MSSCSGKRPTNLGVSNGELQLCPGTPNCVVSQNADEFHRIAPLNANIEQVKNLLETMDRVEIIEATDSYLYAEFTSKIFRFVDDVEFYFSAEEKVLHVRSASRLGKSDLGANRKRIEQIRSALQQN
ncbi:MAG: DUF1499 domain-containing protein [SAR324 cluster bacterium]|nr:DUF1499 domain-containing protein [SAR324 cluster bacterium]